MSRLDEIREVIRDGMLLEHEEARYLLALTDKLLAALDGVMDEINQAIGEEGIPASWLWEPPDLAIVKARAAIEECKK